MVIKVHKNLKTQEDMQASLPSCIEESRSTAFIAKTLGSNATAIGMA